MPMYLCEVIRYVDEVVEIEVEAADEEAAGILAAEDVYNGEGEVIHRDICSAHPEKVEEE